MSKNEQKMWCGLLNRKMYRKHRCAENTRDRKINGKSTDLHEKILSWKKMGKKIIGICKENSRSENFPRIILVRSWEEKI